MKSIDLKGTWKLRASRDSVYGIMSDFERMPEYFPKVAESMEIVRKDGERLEIEGVAKSFGRRIPVKMEVTLRPPFGFVSDNVSELGTSGHEEFMIEDDPEGCRINYSYSVTLHRWWLRIFARPLIGLYAMRFWEKAVIDVLKKMLENKE
jgi:hypothetical protein